MAAAGVVSGKVSNGPGEYSCFSLGAGELLLLGDQPRRDARAFLYQEQPVADVGEEDTVVSAVSSRMPAQPGN